MVIVNMDSTYPKKGETITGTVKIKTKCGDDAKELTSNNARITDPDNTGATLNISNITDADSALQDTPADTECTVSVDAEKKTLTINYKKDNEEKCITITLDNTDTKKAAGGGVTETATYGHIFAEAFDTILSH